MWGQGLSEQLVRRDHACGDRGSASSLTAVWNWDSEETGSTPVRGSAQEEGEVFTSVLPEQTLGLNV